MQTPSGHEKGAETGAGHLQEHKNTEFVWELRNMGRFLWPQQWVELCTYKSVSQESYHCNSYHCFFFFLISA